MKDYTTKQVARAARRSRSAVARLIKEGKLKGERVGRTSVVRFETLGAAAAEVQRLLPKGGWRKRAAAPAKPKKSRSKSAITDLLDFAAFNPETRASLLRMGRKFTLAQLRVLESL